MTAPEAADLLTRVDDVLDDLHTILFRAKTLIQSSPLDSSTEDARIAVLIDQLNQIDGILKPIKDRHIDKIYNLLYTA